MAGAPWRAAGVFAAGLLATAIGLTGCTGTAPGGGTPTPAQSSTGGGASASASPIPSEDAGPLLVPDGSATDNLPLFASVTDTVWASGDRAAGRAYVDALAAAGFDKAAMQVTQDVSTVGNAAESIQFSVLWGDDCLVGQVGPATGDPVAVVVTATLEGTCLVGETRPIDW